MSALPDISFDLTAIRRSKQVCWEPILYDLEDDIEDDTHVTMEGISYRMTPKLMSLLKAAPQLGLQDISKLTILEWQYRLDCLFDAGVSFLKATSDEGPIPLRIRLQDLRQFVGLRVTGFSPIGNADFDRAIRKLRWITMLAMARDTK